MNKTSPILLLLAVLLLLSARPSESPAQSVELLGGNFLNGAINGVALGGATMALKNTTSFEPLRIGAGAGMLYGIGVGVYDITLVPAGGYFYKSGTFNDGTNSSILLLLDTIYGAATGAAVGTSISLLSRSDVVYGLRMGVGWGAWAGFGFGMVDSFVLAKGPGEFREPAATGGTAGGLLRYAPDGSPYAVSLINPILYHWKSLDASGLRHRLEPGIQLMNLRMAL